ncbi:orotidine-5'-phosphate decarboxylase [Hydrotalea sandarakina]|jgi:orotidine-5'-phosphate decarboxylase|uniref:Orotidine-5'-phosphate decarboxylase n=1 Tax=Hydrotalea sandarakina TaxID=1004304 RepID=A0A2W7RTI5_9BACT|nr:orotidine-5'-phosphate decarboxylase [Hydrotalea sandarakina]PZX61840.1 orotidine-5'-phosphate decarboxylase [Hydrotalea sandarakina]
MQLHQLSEQIVDRKNFLCIGLDTELNKIPKHLQQQPNAVLHFNKAIIDATKDYCVSYKINTAFYEAMGSKGWDILEDTLHYIPNTHFTIADAKRGDIGNTAAQYAKAFFETLPFDAVTVAPYMGEDSIKPFLEYTHKTTIVLGLTSNKSSEDFEQLTVLSKDSHSSSSKKLYELVIEKIASWATPNQLMFVVGATKASEMQSIRAIVPEHFFLVPGVGTQGGSLNEVAEFGWNNQIGLLVNVSRAIIYADASENFQQMAAAEAAKYQSEMAEILNRKLRL